MSARFLSKVTLFSFLSMIAVSSTSRMIAVGFTPLFPYNCEGNGLLNSSRTFGVQTVGAEADDVGAGGAQAFWGAAAGAGVRVTGGFFCVEGEASAVAGVLARSAQAFWGAAAGAGGAGAGGQHSEQRKFEQFVGVQSNGATKHPKGPNDSKTVDSDEVLKVQNAQALKGAIETEEFPRAIAASKETFENEEDQGAAGGASASNADLLDESLLQWVLEESRKTDDQGAVGGANWENVGWDQRLEKCNDPAFRDVVEENELQIAIALSKAPFENEEDQGAAGGASAAPSDVDKRLKVQNAPTPTMTATELGYLAVRQAVHLGCLQTLEKNPEAGAWRSMIGKDIGQLQSLVNEDMKQLWSLNKGEDQGAAVGNSSVQIDWGEVNWVQTLNERNAQTPTRTVEELRYSIVWQAVLFKRLQTLEKNPEAKVWRSMIRKDIGQLQSSIDGDIRQLQSL